MTTPILKLFISGQWQDSKERREIRSPFSGERVAESCMASAEQMEQAIAAADSSFQVFKKTSRILRSRLLSAMAAQLASRRKEFADRIVLEAGKPRAMAEGEVARALQTFTIAAEEAKRLGGEVVPMDLDAAGRAYAPAMSLWVPKGPVLAIAPFNFPLNLIAHKIAPALAIGASVIIKPPPQAPGCADLLAEIFMVAVSETEDARERVPEGALQVVQAGNEVVSKAVTDPRISVLSFTGSDKVGWMLQGQAVGKKVILELGGNAAVIVHSDADLARAASRCAFGAFAYAGQVCISVQRIFVQNSVYPAFKEALLKETAKVKCGDPERDGVWVGPLIDGGARDRLLSWIGEAKQAGARVLAGGGLRGNILEATVLEAVPKNQHLACDEAFGPVVVLEPFESFEGALTRVNDSRFGLQAGVFTQDQLLIQKAFAELDVGGILINEVPTYRADHVPYGGMKESGLGREGVRYAMEDYCERKILIQWMG